jgi:hypothetical protein
MNNKIFECNNCGKKYTTKFNLKKHIMNGCDKKYVRDLINDNILDGEINDENMDKSLKNLECYYCKKKFSQKCNVIKHIRNNCHIYKNLIKDIETNKILKLNDYKLDEIKKEINIKNEKIDRLENLIKEFLGKNFTENKTLNNINNSNNSLCNNNISNSNNSINQQNIVLLGHGKEDLDAITKSEYMKALEKGFNSIVKLTELIHFNNEYPQNQNIFIPNEKQKIAKQYDGKKWISVSKKKLIEDLFYNKRDIVCEKMEEYSDNLSEIKINALNRMLESDNIEINKIKDDLEMLLYNNRDIVKKNFDDKLNKN